MIASAASSEYFSWSYYTSTKTDNLDACASNYTSSWYPANSSIGTSRTDGQHGCGKVAHVSFNPQHSSLPVQPSQPKPQQQWNAWLVADRGTPVKLLVYEYGVAITKASDLEAFKTTCVLPFETDRAGATTEVCFQQIVDRLHQRWAIDPPSWS